MNKSYVLGLLSLALVPAFNNAASICKVINNSSYDVSLAGSTQELDVLAESSEVNLRLPIASSRMEKLLTLQIFSTSNRQGPSKYLIYEEDDKIYVAEVGGVEKVRDFGKKDASYTLIIDGDSLNSIELEERC